MGTFQINSVAFLLEPSESGWTERQPLGLDGNNQLIYPPIYAYEMAWGIMTLEEFDQLYQFWLEAANGDGTALATLPPRTGTDYDTFVTVTAVPDEPVSRRYNNRHRYNVGWRLRNIAFS